MSKDLIDDLLCIGYGFDWITPILNTFAGYNTLEFEGSAAAAIATEAKLKQEGVKCKIESTPSLDGWKVISKRK